MTNPSNIEKTVMRRVTRIRVLRALLSNAVLAVAVLGSSLWGIGRLVWVSKVFENGPQDLVGHAQYLFYAFVHTHLPVEVLTLLVLAALIVLARETARALTHLVIPAHA